MFLLQDSDVAEDDVIASPPEEDAPRAAAVDQIEDLGKSAADSPGIGVESTGEDHSSSSGSLFGSVPDSLPEEQILSAESTADDDDIPEANDSSMGATGSLGEDLAIVPHVGHDDDSATDTDVDPISFSLPQTVLTSAGMPSLVLISSNCATEQCIHVCRMFLCVGLPQVLILP